MLFLPRLMFCLLLLLVGAGSGIVTSAHAQSAPPWRHALSLLGTPKYAADFKQFDYVNASAPKGGYVRISQSMPFDSLNIAISRGIPAAGLDNYVFEPLLRPALDEANTYYGALAEAVQHPDDFSSVTYRLRANARWEDGKPVTAEDVVWSFQVQSEDPARAFYYRNVVKVQKTGEREVTFTFDAPGNRELPMIVGQIHVLPKHWWTGKNKDGQPRDIRATSLEVPPGSGPYRIKSVDRGRSIVYERVANWWGAAVPVYVGMFHFNEIRMEVYRDSAAEFEAFKADDFDWRVEDSAKNWATGYEGVPAVKDGRIVRENFPMRHRGIMQAFVFNLRKQPFSDMQVRRAFNFAFDFEEMNATLFYGQYSRISSYFSGTELASSALPSGRELDILNTVRAQVQPELFTKPYSNPMGGNPQALRDNLREAFSLLKQAGFVLKGQKLVHERTQVPLKLEILLNGQAMQRVALPYKQNLERLGIEVSVRVVDASQYIERIRKRDFDMIVASWPQSLSPGNEQREFWGSEAATRDSSRNYAGIAHPAVDALIDAVIYAKNREDLVAATRALDRVLLFNHYVVPQWFIASERTARWNRFGHPATLPAFSLGFPDIWWYDPALAARVGGRS